MLRQTDAPDLLPIQVVLLSGCFAWTYCVDIHVGPTWGLTDYEGCWGLKILDVTNLHIKFPVHYIISFPWSMAIRFNSFIRHQSCMISIQWSFLFGYWYVCVFKTVYSLICRNQRSSESSNLIFNLCFISQISLMILYN